jgi:hypothetical protein
MMPTLKGVAKPLNPPLSGQFYEFAMDRSETHTIEERQTPIYQADRSLREG